MIPFVENAFKHGSSKLLNDPKVKLSIRVEDDNLFFELMNNKPLDTEQSMKPNGKGGIGLKNARKRLELLYPGQHQLKIESTESTFSVRMKITIVEVNDSTVKHLASSKKLHSLSDDCLFKLPTRSIHLFTQSLRFTHFLKLKSHASRLETWLLSIVTFNPNVMNRQSCSTSNGERQQRS